MTAIREFSSALLVTGAKLSKEEQLLLEAQVFTRVCGELMEIIRIENKDYFFSLKINTDKRKAMIETNFIRCLIRDILSTEEYTLPGIAYYTDTPEDIIYEVATGCNSNPSLLLSQKIIDLHRAVRPEIYSSIVNKIKDDSLIS